MSTVNRLRNRKKQNSSSSTLLSHQQVDRKQQEQAQHEYKHQRTSGNISTINYLNSASSTADSRYPNIRAEIPANKYNSKTKTEEQPQQQSEQAQNQSPTISSPSPLVHKKRPKIFTSTSNNAPSHSPQLQAQYESYIPLKQCNPNGVSFSLSQFPHSIQMHSQNTLPLGFTFSPMLVLQNPQTPTMEKNIQFIPRCGMCFAYMNCYNRFEGNPGNGRNAGTNSKKFVCFICNTTNYNGEYDPALESEESPYHQLHSSIYQTYGSPKFYPNIPSQQYFVFVIDINFQSSNTSVRVLQYLVAAMKEVLSREQFDQTQVSIFLYDQVVYEIDLSGKQIQCTVMDRTIDGLYSCSRPSPLKLCRPNLLLFLDELTHICAQNRRKGSNFASSFDYIYNITRNLGPKYFIIQTNELIGSQGMFTEELNSKIVKEQQLRRQNPFPPKSAFESKNKIFFDLYAQKMLNEGSNICYFTFARAYKNTRVFSQCFKITNSDIKYYSKDSEEDMTKFYYEFSYQLSCTYFKDVRVEFLISQGWHYTAVYGSSFRTSQRITFSLPSIQPSKKYVITVSPSKNVARIPPYCAIQLVVNYRYRKQHYVTVATILQTVTGHVHKMYAGIDPAICASALIKGFLTNIRAQQPLIAKRKLAESVTKIYMSALQHFKTKENVPYGVMSVLKSSLAVLKSMHSQPQVMLNSPIFDRTMAERNMLQFCNCAQVYGLFVPYLFDLSEMDESMCRRQQTQNPTDPQPQFIYPPTIEPRFQSIKCGLFLLDAGLVMYLFIAKNCDLQLLTNIFGKCKFSKSDNLNQDLLNEQQTLQAQQVRNLIQYLRDQKSYGWVPVYVVRCGQGSINERNFYLFFYEEKYDEFKSYKHSFQEYLELLRKLVVEF